MTESKIDYDELARSCGFASAVEAISYAARKWEEELPFSAGAMVRFYDDPPIPVKASRDVGLLIWPESHEIEIRHHDGWSSLHLDPSDNVGAPGVCGFRDPEDARYVASYLANRTGAEVKEVPF